MELSNESIETTKLLIARGDTLKPAPIGIGKHLDVLPFWQSGLDWYGIRLDGSIVSVEGEEPFDLQVETEPIILHVTLVQGVKRYPELEELKPIRGEQDLTCDTCGGTGIHPLDQFSVLCYCGGAGWIPVEAGQLK